MSTQATPDSLIRPELLALKPYRVADARGLIKLDAMENPYPWPGDLVEEWLGSLRAVQINRYPDAGGGALKQQIRDTLGVPEQASLMLGNGSDELIQILAMAVASPGRSMLTLEPGFVMYRMVAAYTGLAFRPVALGADFGIDRESTLQAVARHDPALVFVAHPNNPTGNRFDVEDILALVRAANGLVVVDEAYFAFCDHSFMGSLPDHPNLLVMRTLSKLGLAGLRLGFLVGQAGWLAELEKLRLPYNINTLSQLSAGFALRHWPRLEAQAAAIISERRRLADALGGLGAVEVFPSQANFLLFRVAPGQAAAVYAGLLAAGILIKNLDSEGALRDCLRVTVGAADDNDQFIAALTVLV